MIDRATLRDWVVEALRNLNRSAQLVEVLKEVWRLHQQRFKDPEICFTYGSMTSDGLSTALRHEGLLRSAEETSRGTWELVREE